MLINFPITREAFTLRFTQKHTHLLTRWFERLLITGVLLLDKGDQPLPGIVSIGLGPFPSRIELDKYGLMTKVQLPTCKVLEPRPGEADLARGTIVDVPPAEQAPRARAYGCHLCFNVPYEAVMQARRAGQPYAEEFWGYELSHIDEDVRDLKAARALRESPALIPIPTLSTCAIHVEAEGWQYVLLSGIVDRLAESERPDVNAFGSAEYTYTPPASALMIQN